MQGKSSFQHRAQHAAAELHKARAALCRALLKVQALEHESETEDDVYRRLLPAGLGKTLKAFGSLLDMAVDDWCKACVPCTHLVVSCQVTYVHH